MQFLQNNCFVVCDLNGTAFCVNSVSCANLEPTETAAVLWHEYKANLDALLVRAGVDDMERHCMHSEF